VKNLTSAGSLAAFPPPRKGAWKLNQSLTPFVP
jgi:hypothetical protein